MKWYATRKTCPTVSVHYTCFILSYNPVSYNKTKSLNSYLKFILVFKNSDDDLCQSPVMINDLPQTMGIYYKIPISRTVQLSDINKDEHNLYKIFIRNTCTCISEICFSFQMSRKFICYKLKKTIAVIKL